MENVGWVEWLGYFSSVLVAISLMMSSPMKLRWLNLAGAICFTFYGVMIKAYPIAAINLLLIFINSYHLYNLYTGENNKIS